MSLNVYWLAFIGALIGVVGTGIGVIAALIPTILTGKRDYFQRLVNLWNLLYAEAKTIPIQCMDRKENTPASNTTQSMVPLENVAAISPLSLTAWHAVSANAEFVASLTEKQVQQIYRAYVLAETLNASINFYALYTSTAAMMNHSFPNTDLERVKEAFTRILKQDEEVIQAFSNLQDPLTKQIAGCQRSAERYERWMILLSWISGVIFGAAIIACAILAVVIYFHG
jgi:hypothetical protein